jgi:hypothetical protein
MLFILLFYCPRRGLSFELKTIQNFQELAELWAKNEFPTQNFGQSELK